MALGTNSTPGSGWFQGVGVSDALSHWATVTLEFPTFTAFAAYKPSVVTTILSWAGAPVVAHTAGYYAAGDGGSATYVWNSTSVATPDTLFVVIPGGSAGGRWFLQVPSGGVDIRALGVPVDGATSADSTLRAAIAACSTYGTKLFFPPGIVYLTGAASSFLQNCSLQGVGILPGTSTTGPSLGSMVYLTSASTVPFYLGQDFVVDGINFYWPGQTGAVSYPALFSGDSVHTVAHGYFHNITVVDAYDGVVQGTEGWVDVKFDNYETFAAHDNFRWYNTADGITLTNVRVIPGAWLGMGGSNAAVGTSASTARAFHITTGGTVNLNAINLVVVGARYGFLVDSGASVAESQINAAWDAVGTIIDTSSGGNWYGIGIQFTGIAAGCATPATTWGAPNTGQAPCFNMGSSAFNELNLTDFHSGGSQGDFITTAGTDVILENSEALSIGSVLATTPGAGDFYAVHITASGTPNVRIQNNRFVGGVTGIAHIHGISTTGAGIPGLLVIQGNSFSLFNDDVDASFPQGAIVSGNSSSGTNGSVSLIQVNTNAIIYYGNNWDVPPVATVSSCGSSPSVTGAGPNAGFITTGGGTVNSCNVTMPLVLYGKCLFQPANAISLGAMPSGTPNTWALSFYVGASPNSNPGMNIFYSCPGMQ